MARRTMSTYRFVFGKSVTKHFKTTYRAVQLEARICLFERHHTHTARVGGIPERFRDNQNLSSLRRLCCSYVFGSKKRRASLVDTNSKFAIHYGNYVWTYVMHSPGHFLDYPHIHLFKRQVWCESITLCKVTPHPRSQSAVGRTNN